MYSFPLKDDGPDIDIIITRALLALAAVATLLYRTDQYFFINIIVAVLLFFAAVFAKMLVHTYRINKLLMLAIAAILLFIATRSFPFAIILLLYGSLIKFFSRPPSATVSADGVRIKKLFAEPLYPWEQFNNVILKDQLLTLDFKNNKLLQLTVDQKVEVDEKGFNEFCYQKLAVSPAKIDG